MKITHHTTENTSKRGIEKKPSPQYIRTHNAICLAMIRLLRDYAFEKITVQMILDTTPVTRTTFYKHFIDKYQVAETLQEQFFHEMELLINKLHEIPTDNFSQAIYNCMRTNRELVEALTRIHTDQVDLQQNLSAYMKDNYLMHNHSPYSNLSASVYASALTTFQIANVQNPEQIHDMRNTYNQVMIEAFLNIFNLEDDDYLRDYIQKKVDE